MSSFFYNSEDLKYQFPKDDPIEQYFKVEEDSTEPPFSLKSEESGSAYNNQYYGYHMQNYDDMGYKMQMPNGYGSMLTIQNVQEVAEIPSLNSKSKKIKREAAKKRTQMKKSTPNSIVKDDTLSKISIQDTASQCGGNDEKSNKKLKQMIRNRISAQNSRDRKKSYISNLEKSNQMLQMQNSKLLSEIAALKENNRKVQLEKEDLMNQLKKECTLCPHCGFSTSPSQNSTDERISIPSNTDDIVFEQLTRENGGGSPLFSRLFGGSSPRSFFSYTLTFATLFSLVLLLNINGNVEKSEIGANKFYMVGPLRNISTTPVVEAKIPPVNQEMAPMIIEQPAINLNTILAPSLKLPFLQNILSLQKYFNENAMKAFFTNLKLNEGITPCPELEAKTGNELVKAEVQPMVIEYNFLNHSTKSRNEMIEKSSLFLPIEKKTAPSKFSTLFCPAGFEFFDTEEEISTINPSDSRYQKGILDSEYIQFYIPKRQVQGVFKDKNRSDIIIPSGINGDISGGAADDNAIIEIWCKVFQIRELQSNI